MKTLLKLLKFLTGSAQDDEYSHALNEVFDRHEKELKWKGRGDSYDF